MAPVTFSPWRFRFAVLTALSTLPLIFLGGVVTSRDAGMAVPDWPTSFEYNMFTFPVSRWLGDVFYEHFHRLLGSWVGFLTLVLTLWVQLRDNRSWIRKLGWFGLAAVIVQGLMGGLRVRLAGSPEWGSYAIHFAMIHGCLAQAFFVFICFFAYFQSREWHRGRLKMASPEAMTRQAQLTFVTRLAFVAALLVFMQSIAGAIVRHIHQGVIYHASFALVVVCSLAGLLVMARRSAGRLAIVRELTLWIGLLLVFQVGLGLLSWLALPQVGYFQDWPNVLSLIPTCHQVTGALILLATAFLCSRLSRIDCVAPAQQASAAPTAGRVPELAVAELS